MHRTTRQHEQRTIIDSDAACLSCGATCACIAPRRVRSARCPSTTVTPAMLPIADVLHDVRGPRWDANADARDARTPRRLMPARRQLTMRRNGSVE